ncbi:MAG: nitroreductase family deazaflavin-dependent oxidoreductase [Pseudomonadales bacterium]|nr:nitroreductase family deazaflavin-dependent oxidoreductase [Pseudomonadales bacterium]
MAEDVTSFNVRIIEEFRANNGVVGAPFAGAPLLLLGTIGAKSGAARVNPLAYTKDGEDLIIIASFAGADQHPPWFYNLKANPEVTVEVGSDTYQATAQIVDEPERTRLYTQMEEQMSTFTDYREKTERVIPVVRLQRI